VAVGRAGRRNGNAFGEEAEGLTTVSEGSFVRIRHVGIHLRKLHGLTRSSCGGKPGEKKEEEEEDENGYGGLGGRGRHCGL